MAKLNSSELKILDEIAEWKGEGPGFLNRATEFMSRPLSWVTKTLVPDNVKGAMQGISEKITEKLRDASEWTVDKNEVLRATREFEIDSDTIVSLKKASIHDLDHVSERFMQENIRYATVTGLGTGLAGWPGLIADLPTLFMISLRSIYQTSLCYGFDPEAGKEEDATRQRDYELGYMLRIFKVATAANVGSKQKALAELKDFEMQQENGIYKEVGTDYTTKHFSRNTMLWVSPRIIKEIVEQIILRKATALVPGLGALFNAGFNYMYLKDVGDSAFMLYRERFLLDKKGRKRIINIDIE